MPKKNTNDTYELYKASFAKRLRVKLAAADMNATKLADLIGVTSTVVYDYLHGKHLSRADKLAQMCVVLKTDANDMLGIRRYPHE